MDDTSGPVRDAAAETLGTLLKLVGERTMGPFVDQLDKIKLDKVCWLYATFVAEKNDCVVSTELYITGLFGSLRLEWNITPAKGLRSKLQFLV